MDSFCPNTAFGWIMGTELLTLCLYWVVVASFHQAGKSNAVLFNYLSWHYKYCHNPSATPHLSLHPSIIYPSFRLWAKHIKLNLSFWNREGHWKPAQIDRMITQHTINCHSQSYVGLTFTTRRVVSVKCVFHFCSHKMTHLFCISWKTVNKFGS